MTFAGIPVAALDFYDDLEADNSKAFWTEHKPVYAESVRAPMEDLCTALEPAWGPGKLFRPYRDVRFSKDKTPYKTHQGAWFDESSRYVQISAAGLMVAGGYWRMSSEQVGRLRRAVDDDVAGPVLERAVRTVGRKKLRVGGEQLTRVPAGFGKEHPRGDLLRHKTLTVSCEPGFPDWLHTPAARTEIVKLWRAMEPVVGWLETHVGRD